MTSQQWTYRVNISVSGTVWSDISPLHEDFSLSKNRIKDEIFGRFEFSTIKVKDGDVTFFNILAQQKQTTEIQVFLNGVQQAEGILELLPDADDRLNIYEFTEIKASDKYTDLIDNYDTEVNIATEDLLLYKVFCSSELAPLTFKLSSNFSSGPGSLWDTYSEPTGPTEYGGSVNIYARQEATVTDYQASILIGVNGWELLVDNGDGTQDIARDWTDSQFANVTPVQNENYGPYDLFSSPQGRTINTLYNNGATTHLLEDQTDITDYTQVGLFNNIYYASDALEYTYNRFRDFFETVKYIVGELDASINFDETGTSTDSFYYFKNFTDGDGNNPLANLFISGISDFVLDNGIEKSNPQTIANITWKKLTDMLKDRWNIFWDIEDRSGTYYMVFKHWTETSKSVVSNPTANNWYNINWTVDKLKYNYIKERLFKLLKRQEVAGNIDFIGKDIETVGLVTNKVVSYLLNNFFFDVLDIQNNPGNYPGSSTNQFVIVTVENETIEGDELGTKNINNTSYETFSYDTGTHVLDVVNSSGSGSASLATAITLDPSEALQFDYDLTVNSGEVPTILFNGVNYQLEAGSGKTLYVDPVQANAGYFFSVQVTGNSDFELTLTTVQKYAKRVIESTGAITGNQVVNAALSLANADDDHIGRMPIATVKVNGVQTTLSANQLLKTREIETIKAPLEDFARWSFDELVPTDLGNAEIDGITQKNDNSLAEFKLIY